MQTVLLSFGPCNSLLIALAYNYYANKVKLWKEWSYSYGMKLNRSLSIEASLIRIWIKVRNENIWTSISLIMICVSAVRNELNDARKQLILTSFVCLQLYPNLFWWLQRGTACSCLKHPCRFGIRPAQQDICTTPEVWPHVQLLQIINISLGVLRDARS